MFKHSPNKHNNLGTYWQHEQTEIFSITFSVQSLLSGSVSLNTPTISIQPAKSGLVKEEPKDDGSGGGGPSVTPPPNQPSPAPPGASGEPAEKVRRIDNDG